MWWINIPGAEVRYWDVLSGVNEPLLDYGDTATLLCRVRAISPAHTLPLLNVTV